MKMRKGNSVQSKICMLVIGSHGTGKSTFALGSMYLKTEEGRPFRVLYIDNENGSVDDYCRMLEQDGINTDNLLITYTTSLVETNELIKTATDKKPFYDEDGNVILDADGKQFVPDMIVVDGMSILHKTAVQSRREFSKKRATVRAKKKDNIDSLEKFVMVDGADIELKDYSQINFDGQSLVLNLTASGLHYIATAREEEIFDKKIIKVNGVDKEVSVSTGKFRPEGFKGSDYNVKTYARLYRDSEQDPTVKMIVTKDRTNTFPKFSVIEDPTVTEFQKLIDSNKGLKQFVLANNVQEDIKKDMAKIEKETLGTMMDDVTVPTAPVEETSTEVTETAPTENLSAKVDKIKLSIQHLTPNQKTTLKEKMKEVGMSHKLSDIKTAEQADKYNEILTAIIS